jgi:uncharacterized protein with HEPN domain
MQLESRKYLHDVRQAIELLIAFTAGKDFAAYAGDPMLKSAVERQFEVFGEALSQLAQRDVDTASQIADYRQIIAFRNILIHGYAQIDDRLVWDIVASKLPTLRIDVARLLQE